MRFEKRQKKTGKTGNLAFYLRKTANFRIGNGPEEDWKDRKSVDFGVKNKENSLCSKSII